MSRSTRSKMASALKSPDELTYPDDCNDGDNIFSSKLHSVSKTTPLYSDSPTGSTLAGSTILNHKFRLTCIQSHNHYKVHWLFKMVF